MALLPQYNTIDDIPIGVSVFDCKLNVGLFLVDKNIKEAALDFVNPLTNEGYTIKFDVFIANRERYELFDDETVKDVLDSFINSMSRHLV